jgi:hypothetical protein
VVTWRYALVLEGTTRVTTPLVAFGQTNTSAVFAFVGTRGGKLCFELTEDVATQPSELAASNRDRDFRLSSRTHGEARLRFSQGFPTKAHLAAPARNELTRDRRSTPLEEPAGRCSDHRDVR